LSIFWKTRYIDRLLIAPVRIHFTWPKFHSSQTFEQRNHGSKVDFFCQVFVRRDFWSFFPRRIAL